jgi:hypothetical protein
VKELPSFTPAASSSAAVPQKKEEGCVCVCERERGREDECFNPPYPVYVFLIQHIL